MTMRKALVGPAVLLLTWGCSPGSHSANNETVVGDDFNAAVPDDGVDAAPATNLIFCAEINRRTTLSDCEDLTATASQAKDGTAAFNVPDMIRDRPSPIELSISLAPPSVSEPVATAVSSGKDEQDAATANIQTKAAPMPSPSPVVVFSRPAARLARRESERPVDDVSALPGHAEQYSPLVGRDMRAELIGEGFNVVARSPASQTLSPGGTTTWDWEVTPLHGANYALTIKTSVEGVMANGQRVVLGSTTRTRRVRVKVLWYDTMQDDLAAIPLWIKLVLGIVVPLTALIWAVRKLVAAISGRSKPPDTSDK